MYWTAYRAEGFPFFTEGGFDMAAGHDAPPSLHLSSSGRNVCYIYSGPQTRVRPNSTYRVAGFVRPAALTHARAVLAACFVDEDQEPLLDTLVRSELIGSEGDEWVEVSVELPAAPPAARTIGLLALVLQRDTWDTAARKRGNVEFSDVRGGAWFDDITVYALPLIQMRASTPTHVFEEGDGEGVDIRITAFDPAGLRYGVKIFDAAGGVVRETADEVGAAADGAATRIDPAGLPPGIYRAELTVFELSRPLTHRSLTFAYVVPQRAARPASTGRPFGVALWPRERCDPQVEAQLLLQQGVRSAKVPMWSGALPAALDGGEFSSRSADQELMTLYRSGFALIGVFAGAPEEVLRASGAYRPSLLETLTTDAAAWSKPLADVVAPYATMIQAWQVGADAELDVVVDARLPAATEALREQMRRFIHQPVLVTPASAAVAPESTAGGDGLSLTLGREILPDHIAAHVDVFRKAAGGRLDAYVETSPDHVYDRQARLHDWAQRVILARHAGAETVFVPQTWSVRDADGQTVIEPHEEFLLLRTLTDVIGDAQPGLTMRINETARAVVFTRAGQSVVALWDRGATAAGREYDLQLDEAGEAIDLWGNRIELLRGADGRQKVQLTPMPILVDGVAPWVFEFQEAATLTPASLPFSVEPQTRTLSLKNPTPSSMSGEVALSLPVGWEARPSIVRFELPPQGTNTYPIELRYPSGESAGAKSIGMRLTVNGSPPKPFEKQVVLELGIPDVDVWAVAYVDRSMLIVRHNIRNRTSETLSFRGFVSAPGRARQYRHIMSIPPGGSRIEEYTLPAAALSGKPIRVGLRELDGQRIHNLVLQAP